MSLEVSEIVAGIDRRLLQAREEIERLQAARRALAESTGAERRSSKRRRGTRRSTATAIDPATLVNALAGSAGLTTGELAKAVDGQPARVLQLMKEREAAGVVRRTGRRRATRWHLFTEEDKIAARAAEIAQQSRRGQLA